MKLIKRLVQVGVAVGLVKAGSKVAEHYRENNPEGVQDVNGDGKIDYKDKVIEVTRAAEQTFVDIGDKVIDKMSR